jgi:hypothetical protein
MHRRGNKPLLIPSHWVLAVFDHHLPISPSAVLLFALFQKQDLIYYLGKPQPWTPGLKDPPASASREDGTKGNFRNFFFFLMAVWGFEFRASHLLAGSLPLETWSQPFFFFCFSGVPFLPGAIFRPWSSCLRPPEFLGPQAHTIKCLAYWLRRSLLTFCLGWP